MVEEVLPKPNEESSRGLSESVSQDLMTTRKDMLMNIVQNGLKSAATLEQEGYDFYGSVEAIPCEEVYGRNVKPRRCFMNSRFYKNSIKQALYWTDESVLTVVAEREGERIRDVFLYQAPREIKDRLKKRLSSSVVLVYRGDDISDSVMTREGFSKEEKDLESDKLLCVLIPAEIATCLKREELDSLGVRHKIVRKNITRRLYHGDKIKVPNYEGEIKELLDEYDHPLWIHGVRFPTQEDLDSKQEGEMRLGLDY